MAVCIDFIKLVIDQEWLVSKVLLKQKEVFFFRVKLSFGDFDKLVYKFKHIFIKCHYDYSYYENAINNFLALSQ